MSGKRSCKKDGGIDGIRDEIDRLDVEILSLLNKRARLAREIGRLKETDDSSVYVPSREEEIFRRLAKSNDGPLTDEGIRSIYREVMSASRALEKRLVVAYLGPEGTFTHQAAKKRFGDGVDYVASPDIEAVFTSVARGEAEHGVVPVENSTGGPVVDTLDLFQTVALPVIAEVVLPISHCLVGNGPLEKVKSIYSKPIAFTQCRTFLSRLSGVRHVPAASTAEAARLASSHKNAAAIASSLAAELYDLEVLAEHVEDDLGNQTRFWVLGGSWGRPTGHDKTSLMFAVKNQVGALHDMLVPFKRNGVNLTKIESRPSRRGTWDYVFFVDVMGHCEDDAVARAIASLEKKCSHIQIIGSYPV